MKLDTLSPSLLSRLIKVNCNKSFAKLIIQKKACIKRRNARSRDPMTPESVWVSETSTDRENTFNNLKSVAKYWFRVIAVGKAKQMVYSPPVAMVVQ